MNNYYCSLIRLNYFYYPITQLFNKIEYLITNIIYSCSPDPSRSSRDDIALLRSFALSSCKMCTGHPLRQPTTTCKFSALSKKSKQSILQYPRQDLLMRAVGTGSKSGNLSMITTPSHEAPLVMSLLFSLCIF